jgi:hypothetical protein
VKPEDTEQVAASKGRGNKEDDVKVLDIETAEA